MKKLTLGQMQSQEVAANVWLVKPEIGVTKDDMLKPAFWGHVARNLRRFDTVKALAEDGSWYAEFVVRGSNDLEAMLGETVYVEFKDEAPESADEEYTVVWAGPTAKFRVVRVGDKVTMKEGFQSKELAHAWLALPLDQRLAA